MNISDISMIAVVLIAPLLAVQVQKFVERVQAANNQKKGIFFTLMAHRATPISAEYVQALNMIDVVFYKDKHVREAWGVLLDHFSHRNTSIDEAIAKVWNDRADEYRLKLLQEISKVCGYEFNAVSLKNGNYYPEGHGKLEEEVTTLRRGVISLLTGEKALTVSLKDKPPVIPQ